MKQVLNTRRLKTGRFFATSLTVAGLVLLIASTLISLNPQLGASSFPILIMGVVASTLGIRLSHQWTRAPYTHDVLSSALKGLPTEATLLHYWEPSDHILITPNSIIVLTPFRPAANVTISDNEWHENDPLFTRLRRNLALETIANAQKRAFKNQQNMIKWLDRNFSAHDVQVDSYIVFTNADAQLVVHNQSSPIAAYADKRKPNLKSLIRTIPSPAVLVPIDEIASRIQKPS